MLLPTIVQELWDLCLVEHRFLDMKFDAIFDAFELVRMRAKETFEPLYRFCKSTGQNGRILPNSIMRPAIAVLESNLEMQDCHWHRRRMKK